MTVSSEGICSPIDACFASEGSLGVTALSAESLTSVDSTDYFCFFIFASIFCLASLIAFVLAICLAFSFNIFALCCDLASSLIAACCADTSVVSPLLAS